MRPAKQGWRRFAGQRASAVLNPYRPGRPRPTTYAEATATAAKQGGEAEAGSTRLWDTIPAKKFTCFRHVSADGLAQNSEAVLPKLPVRKGDQALEPTVASTTRPSGPSRPATGRRPQRSLRRCPATTS